MAWKKRLKKFNRSPRHESNFSDSFYSFFNISIFLEYLLFPQPLELYTVYSRSLPLSFLEIRKEALVARNFKVATVFLPAACVVQLAEWPVFEGCCIEAVKAAALCVAAASVRPSTAQ